MAILPSRHAAGLVLAVAAMLLGPLRTAGELRAQQEIPPPTPNIQAIPVGSLIIAMDNAKQSIGFAGSFNTKAYGLAFRLLHNNVPLLWTIRSGKAKDGTDFTATVRRVRPTAATVDSTLAFSGGPFVILPSYAAAASSIIAAYGNNVVVYEVKAALTADVRYALHFKPRPFVNTTNSGLATKVLIAAGIPAEAPGVPGYVIGTNTQINGNGCWTILIEPHNTAQAVDSVRKFLQNGGNYYAQCASVSYAESHVSGRFLTTLGIVDNNTGAAQTFPNPDLAFSQFIGTVNNSPGGSEEDWILAASSVFRSTSSIHAQSTGVTPQRYSAMAGKLIAGAGGNVFYVGGHDNSGTGLGDVNLQRLMLNAIFIPASRPTSCGFELQVPDLTISKTHTGNFTAGANGTYTLTVTNVGPGATTDTAYVVDTLPTGFTYVSAAGTGWTFSVVGQVVTAKYPAVLAGGASASFTLTVAVGGSVPPGTITNRAWTSGGGEANASNNLASDPTQIGSYGVMVTPDGAGPVEHLPSNGVVYSYVFTVTNSGGTATPYTLLASLGSATTPFLTIDSITGTTVTRGTRADSAQLASLAPGDSAQVRVWFRVGNVEAGLLQQLILEARVLSIPSILDPGSVTVKVVRPDLAIDKLVGVDTVNPGSDLTYTVTVQNLGTESAMLVVVVDSLPPEVMFKLGSIVSTVPSGGTTVEYSSDEGASWTYVPVSAGCGAPAGYDACVRRIRWTMADPLASATGANIASHVLIARLR